MNTNERLTPQEEAIILLDEVIKALTSSTRDLKTILRKCQLVCELLNWGSQKSWFDQELNGYYPGSQLPSYRKIVGKKIWEIQASTYNVIKQQSEEMVYGRDPAVYDEQPDTLEVWTRIDWFIANSRVGYRESLDETKSARSPAGDRYVTLQRIRVFSAGTITFSVMEIERNAFNFASQAYVQLKYGNAMGDIWANYRRLVDAELSKLTMNQHLHVIESGLQSNNEESWRVAVFECRNLLNDLANDLWRDPRPTYDYLLGNGPNGKLEVMHGEFGNRLAAYIHQKGISGTRGSFLRHEAERLADSIHSLIAVQSEAHDPVSLEDARSFAIRTYFVVGELVTRTDMQPVLQYGEPVDI
jgi:hypothetical protein